MEWGGRAYDSENFNTDEVNWELMKPRLFDRL